VVRRFLEDVPQSRAKYLLFRDAARLAPVIDNQNAIPLDLYQECRRILDDEEHVDGTHHIRNLIRKRAVVSLYQYRLNVSGLPFGNPLLDCLYGEIVDVEGVDLSPFSDEDGEVDGVPAGAATIVDNSHSLSDVEPFGALSHMRVEEINESERSSIILEDTLDILSVLRPVTIGFRRRIAVLLPADQATILRRLLLLLPALPVPKCEGGVECADGEADGCHSHVLQIDGQGADPKGQEKHCGGWYAYAHQVIFSEAGARPPVRCLGCLPKKSSIRRRHVPRATGRVSPVLVPGCRRTCPWQSSRARGGGRISPGV
jgi:hypothetical protein